jgi:hypothetical protein
MANRRKTPKIINDFAVEEDLDICGFSDEPIEGKCIAVFSCCNDSTNKSDESAAAQLDNNNNNNAAVEHFKNDSVASEVISNETLNSNSTDVTINNIAKIESTASTEFTSKDESLSNDANALEDNRNSPIVNGCAPPIDGEYLEIKRTYMLRSSTVRKLNKLKSIHPDLNTYVSTLVDLAIAHYYEHIINENNTK